MQKPPDENPGQRSIDVALIDSQEGTPFGGGYQKRKSNLHEGPTKTSSMGGKKKLYGTS